MLEVTASGCTGFFMVKTTANRDCHCGEQKSVGENESGIALMMSLGILSLILILAMSFSYQAQTDKIAATNRSDEARSRLLAESGLERALAWLSMDYGGEQYPPRGGNAFASVDLNGQTQYYQVSRRTPAEDTGIETALSTGWLPVAILSSLPADASWQDVVDADGMLTGRVSFLILDESGKIDPGAVVTPNHEPFFDSNGDGDYSTGEHYFDIDGDGKMTPGEGEAFAISNEGHEIRVGGSPEEMVISDTFWIALPVVGSSDVKGSWFSIPHMIAAGVSSSPVPGAGYATYFPHSYDIEAWWDETAEADLHRFDLARTDWVDLAVEDILHDAAEFYDGDGNITSIPTSDSGIPWLDGITPDTIRNQVAANLIDYCDADSLPTTDFTPATEDDPETEEDESQPFSATYCGLERVPYLNEIAFRLSYTVANGDTEEDLTDDTGTLTIQPYVELVNVYDESFSANSLILMYRYSIDGTAYEDEFHLSVGSVPAHAYKVVTDETQAVVRGTVFVEGEEGEEDDNTVDEVAVIILSCKAFLSDGDPDETIVPLDLAIADVSTDEGLLSDGMNRYASLQVRDPRANTRTENWSWVEDEETGSCIVETDLSELSGSLGDGLSGMKNSNADPSVAGTGYDLETVDDPKDGVSTAYIRNGPMRSLWELGAIHRGEPWRTINLRKYGTGTPGDYDDGDAGILDQVKLGPYTEMRGKVNLNTPVEAVLQTLFYGISLNGTYADPAGDVEDLGASGNLNTLIDGIVGENGAWASRGAVAKVIDADLVPELEAPEDEEDPHPDVTDRLAEELIGKIANLSTIRQNYFRIIVCAQTLKDIGMLGSIPDGFSEVTKESGGNTLVSVLSEQKIMAIVYRDAFTNRFRIERFEYLDD